MENLEKEVIKTALKKMFKENYFSICTIDKCLKISNTIPDKSVYSNMNALHCVSYSEMSEELRKWLFENVILMFNNNGFDLSIFDVMPMKSEKDTDVEVYVVSEKQELKKSKIQKLLGL